MKLLIKKGLLAWKIIDESGAIVAKISNKKFFGASKKITDVKGNTVFTTDIVNLPANTESWNCTESRRYIVYRDEQIVATATFTYSKNPERTKTQAFTLRPPQVDNMDIDTPYGEWKIQRQKNNGIVIIQDEKTIGTITPFFSFKRMYLEHNGKYEATFWAGIYMLIEYMMHEDELIVV